MTSSLEPGTARVDWPAILAVFAMVIAFTYTDDLVEFIVVVTGMSVSAGQWLVALLDLLLVASTALLKWRIAVRESGSRPAIRAFLGGLLRSWWSVGAVVIVVLHVSLIALSNNLGQGSWLWTSVPLSLLFVAAMGLVLVTTLDSQAPFGAGAWERNGWIVPLLVGTFAVQLASALWFPVINVNDECASQISPDFFGQIVNVVPMLLIPLGLELNYVRRGAGIRNPGMRAAPILTVVLLCLAEALAFSMQVNIEAPRCGIAPVWHEYTAFVVSVQATAIALATLVWLLVADSTSGHETPA